MALLRGKLLARIILMMLLLRWVIETLLLLLCYVYSVLQTAVVVIALSLRMLICGCLKAKHTGTNVKQDKLKGKQDTSSGNCCFSKTVSGCYWLRVFPSLWLTCL